MLRPNGICVHNIIRQKASRFVNCLPFQCRRPMRNCHCSIDACRHMMYWSWLPLLSGQALLHSSTEIPTVHESRSHGGPVKCFQNLSDERVTKVSKKNTHNKTLSLNGTVPGDLEKTLQAGCNIEDCRIEHFTLLQHLTQVLSFVSCEPSLFLRHKHREIWQLKLISNVGRKIMATDGINVMIEFLLSKLASVTCNLLIRFSSNYSPAGVSEVTKRSLVHDITRIFRYPKWNLIRLFWGWDFPYISLTYSLYRWVPPFYQ